MTASMGIAIVGAGMGGLMTALALKEYAGAITVVERDPEPGHGVEPVDAFERWRRPGVPQFRHSHMLLSRLRTIIRDNHPGLLEELSQAGVHASTLDSMLPPTHAEHYTPAPGDDDLVHLWGRRATFEAVVRRYLQRFEHISFRYQTKVEGVRLAPSSGARQVVAVEVRGPSGPEVIPVNVVVDASGKHGGVLNAVQKQGLQMIEEQVPVGYSYFCRHYELDGPCDAPRRGTGGILDYLWFGTFFAEGNHFSIAMACPEEERELCDMMRRAEGFEGICSELPALQQWLARSRPVSPVLGAGKLTNQWRELATEGPSVVHGLFAVGDALVQTNPMYGRGCSAAALQGHLLAETLLGEVPRERQLAVYQRRVREEMRSYFDIAVIADRMFRARGRMARGEAVALGDRFLSWVHEAIIDPAAMEDVEIGRELVRGMQMREASPKTRQLQVLARLLWVTARRPFSGARPMPMEALGPSRSEMLTRLRLQREPTTVHAVGAGSSGDPERDMATSYRSA